MTAAELAYAAGLFEGEGYVTCGSKRPYRPCVGISMCDREPLERMHALFGGNLNGPYDRSKYNAKPISMWYISGWAQVERMLELLGSWLSPRRLAQFAAVIACAPVVRGSGGNHAAKTHCPQGHAYSAENTYRPPGTRWRQCRACRRAVKKRLREARA